MSALTGKGLDKGFLDKLSEAKTEYETIFLPEIHQKLSKRLEECGHK